jgi:predicted MPP superfamily phosphohydrolase
MKESMKKYLIHLSDLHFRVDWQEEQELVLNAFFSDLEELLNDINKKNIYIAFSGDLVIAGAKQELYNAFYNYFDEKLNKIGITRDQRICVPGNHDISQEVVESNFVEHNGIVNQQLNEKKLNDYLVTRPAILETKFNSYLEFENKFAKYGVFENILCGQGWSLDDGIGIYCLNTAICSSGGFDNIKDENQLGVCTRNLRKWILDNHSILKFVIMHHPKEYLNDWAKVEMKNILRNDFNLCLSGHIHDQSVFHSINKDVPLIECSAPPLLTNKKEKLGYAIITFSSNGVKEIQYRQWTKNYTFRSGIDFADTDSGKLIINSDEITKSVPNNDNIAEQLSKRLETALQTFSSQPIIWVEPIISKSSEMMKEEDVNDDDLVGLTEIINSPQNLIIKAPPQFGLTCLSFYLAKEAWRLDNSFWLYIDVNDIKSLHRLEKSINKELTSFHKNITDVKCIILDSWTDEEKDSFQILKAVSDFCEDIPLVIMQTMNETKFSNKLAQERINKEFKVLYLLPLSRPLVRHVVSSYNNVKHIGDENAVMAKLVSDLEVLNIHRTPMNCFTLLKVSEKYFDESPVNRTRMLEMVLTLLFDMDGIPTYKTKPDLKDCEFVLGFFCANLIRTDNYIFSREQFIKELNLFCKEKFLSLEVDVVFDVLFNNNIIIRRGLNYCFRFSYWIFYFAAQRMHQDTDFANYILDNNRYSSFPEIIEFYTGIDRRREDALKIILKDVENIIQIIDSKVGLPEDMNPYRYAQWKPTQDSLDLIQNELSENVMNSKLPDLIKDKYADRNYDAKKPYDQSIYTFFKEYSIPLLVQTTKAASRALRNSDYVDPAIKKELLSAIIKCWDQMSRVLIVLTPLLVTEGIAAYQGATFVLQGDYGEGLPERLSNILSVIPSNIVNWFKNDLFSHKMGPLLFAQIDNEKNEIKKHELLLMVISERPAGWKVCVENYVTQISKNSFYLLDIVNILRIQYRYSFASPQELNEIKHLIKMGIAKHEFGVKKPGLDKIVQISNKAIPKRLVDDE